MTKLSEQEILQQLIEAPNWLLKNDTLVRAYQFEGFMEGIAFVNKVAELAEAADHHPDIDIRWNKVTLILTTHSEDGITAKDFQLARECEEIYR